MRNREGPTVKGTRQDETAVVPATERNAPHGCDQQENRAFLRRDWAGNTTVQDWVVRGAVAGQLGFTHVRTVPGENTTYILINEKSL